MAPDVMLTAEPTHPHPPRYRWLVRLGALGLVLVLALAGVRAWWDHVAKRRLATFIDAAHARGEPILVSDYPSSPPPPDETNAAFYLRRAGGKGLNFSGTETWALENAKTLPLPPELADVAARVVRAHAKQLADVRDARVRWHAKIDWAIAIRSPMMQILLYDLSGQRDLSQLARAAALLAATRGDTGAALEYARDARFIAHAAGVQPFVVSQWFSTAAGGYALALMTDVVADGQLDEPSRDHLRTLIPELLDERRQDELTRDALHGDRAMHLDIGRLFARQCWVLRPSMQLDTMRLLDQDAAVVEAAAAPDWPSAKAKLPTTAPLSRGAKEARLVSKGFSPDLATPLLRARRLSAHMRLAAAALAIRLYRDDQGGQYPPTLDALVPRYLPAVPRDPFAAGAQPIRYQPDGERPYLYTVGENGVDDTAGGWRPTGTEGNALEAMDGFVDLARQNVPRSLPPRPEPPAEE